MMSRQVYVEKNVPVMMSKQVLGGRGSWSGDSDDEHARIEILGQMSMIV
jgi:hypothetical protein